MGNELEYKWEDIFVWGAFDQTQRVDTIEQAFKEDRLGCYVICDTTDYIVQSFGYQLDEALVSLIIDSGLQERVLDHQECIKLSAYLPEKLGADLCVYPASEKLICEVEHYCSVQCKFTGKIAVRADNFSLQKFIAQFKQFTQSYNLEHPLISVYVPENEKDSLLYHPMKYVKEYLSDFDLNNHDELYVYERELATQTKIFIKVCDEKHVLIFEFVLVCSSGNELFNNDVIEIGNIHYIKNNLIRNNARDFINAIFFDEEFAEHFYTSLAPALLNSFSSNNFYFLHPVK